MAKKSKFTPPASGNNFPGARGALKRGGASKISSGSATGAGGGGGGGGGARLKRGNPATRGRSG